MVTVKLARYRGEMILTENTRVISSGARVSHIQTPEGVWLCGKTPKNTVYVWDDEQFAGLRHYDCPKCEAAR